MSNTAFNTTAWTDAAATAGRDLQAAALKAQTLSFDTASTLLGQHFDVLTKQAESAIALGREAMAARDLESASALIGKSIAAARTQAELALAHGRGVVTTLNRHAESLQSLAEKQVAQVKPIKG